MDPKALDAEKEAPVASARSPDEYEVESGEQKALKRHLKGRHMQMIAIGGSIGAGLFVSSGGALSTGGPGSLLICFMIIGS